MEIITTVSEMKSKIRTLREEGKEIGLVPTMGYLHRGHLSLVKRSVSENDITVCSIFVNPLQFGPKEDLNTYPRDFEKDAKLLKESNCDFIFYPSVEEMYSDDFSTIVSVKGITDKLCGKSRPGHFDGVATVVTKLFNIVNPHKAYFGMKDYQQLLVIKKFVRDLNMDVDIIGCEIVRDSDGLALSSRNSYLTENQRKSALSLNRSFEIVDRFLKSGERNAKEIILEVEKFIESFPETKVDYIKIVDKDTLQDIEYIDRDFLYALAVFVGKARLIDNKIFEV